MNIIIYGIRGTGKTTIGKMLAKKLNKKFVDTDEVRFKKFKKTTEQVVSEGGWPAFRKQEKEAVLEIVEKFGDNLVIATGGGTMMNKESVKALKKNSKAIFLVADIGAMVQRISGEKRAKRSNRPFLVADKNLRGEIEEIWGQRKDTYYDLADFVVDTSKIKTKKAVDQIINFLKV
jgi:shikimate kinase